MPVATEQRVPDHFDDFIGAVAEDEVGRRHAEFGGELLFQVKRVAVGVKVHLLERLAHGGQTQARRAERVFVRRELDDAGGVQAEFAGDFLDGPAGLIHRQMVQRGIDGQRVLLSYYKDWMISAHRITEQLLFVSFKSHSSSSKKKKKSDQAARPISTSRLNVLQRLHLWPIKRVVCPWSLGSLRSGRHYLGMSLALRCFQRLSLPHMATQRCR
jgi:hypothetical protein